MKQPMVVTNLRMPQSEYLQIKSIAGELGMSVERIHEFLCERYDQKTHDDAKRYAKKKIRKETIFEAFERIAKMPNKPMGLSEEDEAIYSI